MISLNQFSEQVRKNIETNCPDVWADLNDGPPGWDYHIKKLFQKGYSVVDAISYTRLMSQSLDENSALERMKLITDKYQRNT